MGNSNIRIIETEEERKEYLKHLLQDVNAFEKMLDDQNFEKGVRRFGAEQELVFVDDHYNPAMIGPEITRALHRKNIKTEYASFNIEVNAPPLVLKDDCLKKLKAHLSNDIELIKEAAAKRNSKVLLTGILPTIRLKDTVPNTLTQEDRYKKMLENVNKRRGEHYEFNIKGIDELITRRNPTTFGGCMTSLQLHYQSDADQMVDLYNWAQLISAPTLACATYSPVFLGKRLWHETRIALLRQTTDTRRPYSSMRNEEARVSFGKDWVHQSVAEVFHDDIASYRAFLTRNFEEESMEKLNEGEVPELEALCFHNGTIYRWNRVCYGLTGGKPHLRIENRILPSGPTLEDEVANAAFWLGLMNGMPDKYRNLQEKLEFDEVKKNFMKAARLGIEVQFRWLDGQLISSQELIIEELLPIAQQGLDAAGVDVKDSSHYLEIIRQRTESGRTGSRWMLDSYRQLLNSSTEDESWVAITAAMLERQQQDIPVHEWSLAEKQEAGDWRNRFWYLEQIMSQTLYTLEEDDVIDLATNIMDWKNIGHLPVEREGKLIGIVTRDSLIKFFAQNDERSSREIPVREVMVRDLITATPEMPVVEAIKLILESKVSCLPVIRNEQIVGIVTEHDFVKVSHHLYRELVSNGH
ncbi:MAG: CBS domain-containing protein [Cyclobacteriaceae bacterium]